MRRDSLYLRDIVDSADAIERFLSSINEETFLVDEVLQSAILQKLTVIGEAAARLSNTLKQSCPDIPWRDIVAFRNIAVHAYFAVDWQIVWMTAVGDVPALRQQIAELLAGEPDYDEGNGK